MQCVPLQCSLHSRAAHLELEGVVHCLGTIQQGVAVGGRAAIHAAGAVERGAGRLCLAGGVEDGQALRAGRQGEAGRGRADEPSCRDEEQTANCGRLSKQLFLQPASEAGSPAGRRPSRQAAALTSSSRSLPTTWPRRWNWAAPAWLPPPA